MEVTSVEHTDDYASLRPVAAAIDRIILTILVGVSLISVAASRAGEVVEPHSSAVSSPDSENEFPITLGTFSTTLIGSLAARTENLRLAAAAMDGALLLPGDVLSFNQRVGPRTREHGYQPAPVILHETRQLQPGGGVCQVSSTIFVAALLSGLSVEERHRHSSPVDYIALGEDATIAFGAKDLKIRNDLDQRLRLRVEIVGSTLTARFEGEAPAGAFELETEEREIPGDSLEGVTPGREIEVFRVRHGGGGEVTRDLLHRDVYPPSRTRSAR